MKNESKKIDLFDLFSKDERDYLSQQICEKLTDKGLVPDDYEIIFEGEFLYEIDGEEPFKAKKGDIIFIEKGKAHKMTCVGNERGIRLACGENNFSHVYVKENDKPFGFN